MPPIAISSPRSTMTQLSLESDEWKYVDKSPSTNPASDPP
jgi:hypothetical protein